MATLTICTSTSLLTPITYELATKMELYGNDPNITLKFSKIMDKMIEYKEMPPRIICQLIVTTLDGKLASELSEFFGNTITKYEHELMEVVLAEIDTIDLWDIDVALTMLFESNSSTLSRLYDLVDKDRCKVSVVIVFYHFGKYPSIVFDGRNMEVIRKLKADISIDPY